MPTRARPSRIVTAPQDSASPTAGDYKYDVAFSFLDRDEPLARELAGLLTPLSTFVYSEQQLEVAAKDGVDAFTAVFRRDARIVAVLYRDGWGKTKWTRVEEQAIKSRFLDWGIPLTKGATTSCGVAADGFRTARA